MKTTLFANIKRWLGAGVFALAIASPVMAVTTPVTSTVSADCEARVLGVPPWYRGLTNGIDGDCAIKNPNEVGGLSNFIWKIAFNIIEMALVVVVYIAIGFIMYGGFVWIAGGARPDLVAKGRKALLNAVVGLIISMVAIALVNLVFGVLG